jgi:hypothetical protein
MVMKIILFPFLLLVEFSYSQEKCSIQKFYSSVDVKSGTKGLTNDGDIEEIECILSPITVDEGEYKVTVTKKSNNLYKIDDKDIYIETQYCYEYSTFEAAILVVTSKYGIKKGDIIFIK